MGHKDEQLFAALAVAAQQRIKDLVSKNIANAAWAFAAVGHNDEELFAAVAVAAQQRMNHFNSQDIANTAWAFATGGQKKNEPLFAAFRKAL